MASFSAPIVLVFSLADCDLDYPRQRLLSCLKTKSKVYAVTSPYTALKWLSKPDRPQAILVSDAWFTKKEEYAEEERDYEGFEDMDDMRSQVLARLRVREVKRDRRHRV